jgi:hypothetical protein
MKVTRSLISSIVVCGIALAMVSTAVAESKEYVAKVVRIKGGARYSLGNDSYQPLKVGMILKSGAKIQTGTELGSFVDLILGDVDETSVVPKPRPAVVGATVSFIPTATQNTIHLFEGTELCIDKLLSTETGADVVTETQLELKKGHIIGNIKKMSAASKYEVKLPKGVAGIRGTIYDISDDGKIRVAQGSVLISYLDNNVVKTVTISAGYSFDTNNPGLGAVAMAASDVSSIISAATPPGGAPAPSGATEYNRNDTIWAISPTQGESEEF